MGEIGVLTVVTTGRDNARPMSGYRPPSTEPRGKWAQAIHRKRRSDGMSQTGAFEVLGPRLGMGPKSRAAYVAIDLGLRQPTDAEAQVLVDWLGAYPSDMEAPGPDTTDPGVSALLQALTAQTAAMTALVNRLDQLLPSEKVREMLSWAAEHMPESPSPVPTPETDGSRGRS